MSDSTLSPEPELTEAQRLQLQVTELCKAIPSGKVTSYGALGKQCDPPISGYVCGRVMSNILEQAPWWRVVGKNGKLPISKRSPTHSLEQRRLLEKEGIEFDEENVIPTHYFVEEEEAQLGLAF
jgi:methylated-DNA-protein-cysteine methyltransferase-like protein